MTEGMINKDRMLEEFMELVKIDSVSRNERRLADVLKERLAALGLRVEEDETGKRLGTSAGNLIAHLPGNTAGPTLMFMAHLDTVEPGIGIKPVIRDGVIYSEGETILGADDKAGIVAILEGVRVLKERQLPYPNIEIVFTVMEEIGMLGSKNLELERLNSPDYVFVLDNADIAGTIYTKGPAQNRLEAVILGKAAHAGSNPEEGINAIQAAAAAIAEMRLGRIDPETTANIGIINGGTAINIVCDRVEAKGEARSQSLEKLNQQTEHMVETFTRVAARFGAKAQVSTELVFGPMDVDKSDPVVQICVDAARAIGVEAKFMASGGGTDSNILIGKGLACINLGAAMQKPHSTEEHIRIEDLYQVGEYFLAIVAAALKRGN